MSAYYIAKFQSDHHILFLVIQAGYNKVGYYYSVYITKLNHIENTVKPSPSHLSQQYDEVQKSVSSIYQQTCL